MYKNTLNQLADELRVARAEIEEVLEGWTHEQLVAHLAQFPAEVLDSPAVERRFEQQLGSPEQP